MAKAPVSFWIISVAAVLWTAFGAFDYLAVHIPIEAYLAQFTPEQREYFQTFPAWVVAFWALGVWGAFFGSVALLLRRAWAVWLYAISLVGLIGSSVYTLGMTDGIAIMGEAGAIMSVVIWVVAIALLLYARTMARRGVLR